MADMTTIKGRIAEIIHPNGQGAITAELHQALLLEMVDDINKKKADTDALDALEQGFDAQVSELSAEVEGIDSRVDALEDIFNTYGKNTNNPSCPDPCFWKGDDGWFYIKSTGRVSPFTVKRTLDFKAFEDTGRTFISKDAMNWILENFPTDNYPDVPHFWAPQVLKINNTWVLYLSIVAKNGNKTGPSSIFALTSKTYAGDFSNPIEICSSPDIYRLVNGKSGSTSSFVLHQIIDPYIYCDEASNEVCMLAGSSYGVYRFNLSDDGLSLKDKNITHVAGKTIDNDPSRDKVCEGSFLYARPHNGKTYYYLFASTGDYRKTNYKIVVGRSSKQNAQTNSSAPYAVYFSDKSQSYSNNMREGKFETIIQTDPEVLKYLTTDNEGCVIKNPENKLWGPGHVGGIIEDKNGKTYILYHCHDTTWDGGRKLFVQELLWDENGWPYVESGYAQDIYQIASPIITNTQTIVSYKRFISPFEAYRENGGILFVSEKAYYEYLAVRDSTPLYCENKNTYDSNLKNTQGKFVPWGSDMSMSTFIMILRDNPSTFMGYLSMSKGSPWDTYENCLQFIGDNQNDYCQILINPNDKTYSFEVWV